MKGFTLVELLLVIAIAFIVGSFMFPIGSSFLRAQTLDETAEGLVSTLRRAEHQSIAGKNGDPYGVKVLSESYVLFEGATYATRTVSADESFSYPENISLSGIDEVVFSEIHGTPSVTGTITLTLGDIAHTITITGNGKIER